MNADTAEADESEELWDRALARHGNGAAAAQLVEGTGARVVVSSSCDGDGRRRSSSRSSPSTDTSVGFSTSRPVTWRPPEGERLVRASEIAAWLSAHPEVTSFVILDDDEDFGPLSAKHVRIDARVGLTDEDVVRAHSVLVG